VKLHGRIDRVDLARGGLAALVIDYKLSDERLSLAHVYHGLSLQLLTYLLVLQANGQDLFGKKVVPVAAFYAKLLRRMELVPHPDEALDPNDPKFPLKAKPRGVFDARAIRQLDQSLETGASEVVQARIKQDGTLGNINSSDAADSEAFKALLAFVEKRIGELADQIIAGSIEVRPYRMGLITPCPHCEYRSVCRFDPGINPYLNLQPMKRSVVLDLIREGGGEHGQ
jgi:ATP-dependent helicase/nuclease subunit B